MAANAESLEHIGHERTNFSGETVGTGQLRWERVRENVTFPFVIQDVTGFGDCWQKGKWTIAK